MKKFSSESSQLNDFVFGKDGFDTHLIVPADEVDCYVWREGKTLLAGAGRQIMEKVGNEDHPDFMPAEARLSAEFLRMAQGAVQIGQ